jgi:hypothetical protein
VACLLLSAHCPLPIANRQRPKAKSQKPFFPPAAL